MSRIETVIKRNLLDSGKYPTWLPSSVVYECITGSQAYGVSTNSSDEDIVGICMPSEEIMFPFTCGAIYGFDNPEKFQQWQQHHIIDAGSRKEYDFTYYSVTRFFSLALDNNPNLVDILYTPENCVTKKGVVGDMIRSNRKMFLHQGCIAKFKGYAFSQLNKMENKKPQGKRVALVEKYGFDVKFAYHLLRLMDECEQLVKHGTMDLQRNREELKSVRRGDWTLQEVKDAFMERKANLEAWISNNTCALPLKPQTGKVKKLLTDCLEEHYGDLSKVGVSATHDFGSELLGDLRKIVSAYS